MTRLIAPPLLGLGDPVRVIAPAGAFDRTLFLRGLAWLSEHFRMIWDPALGRPRKGFLAGTVEQRRTALVEAIACPDAKAIIAARGGVGCTDLTAAIDHRALRARPKWLIGYSDITSLHASFWEAGLMTIHGHNVTGLGVGCAAERNAFLQGISALEERTWQLQILVPGECEGPLVGGNLTVLAAHQGTSSWQLPEHCILFLEDIAEPAFRVHRVLRELEGARAFDRIAGLVLGHFTRCGPSTEIEREFRALGERLGVPTIGYLPAGHSHPNPPLLLGQMASIQGARLTLRGLAG